jgi:bifunctional UDP-N-acetylglucosamine pyrophosphorylase/glucosamine-1-phosphate N-acetyltransferase
MRAIILAGGKGRRMFPLDRYWQKAFLPVGNKPNSLRIVEMLHELEIRDIEILTGYKPEWASHSLCGEHGVRISAASDGLGEAIKSLCAPDGWTLVLHGDIYVSKQDLACMTEIPSGEAAAAVLLQSDDAVFRKSDWICAKTDGKRVEAFWGHPRGSYANARSCGVFLLGPEAISHLTTSPPYFRNVPTGGMPPEGFWIENCLQTAIDGNLPVAARYAKHPFVDMDFPWDYLEANQLCCNDETGGDAKMDRDKKKPAKDGKALPPGVIADESCDIGENVLFRGGCTIGRGTVIRNNVVIGENCIIG